MYQSTYVRSIAIILVIIAPLSQINKAGHFIYFFILIRLTLIVHTRIHIETFIKLKIK